MKRVKITLELNVDLDTFEGWGHNSADFVALLKHALKSQVSHYNPKLYKVGETTIIGNTAR